MRELVRYGLIFLCAIIMHQSVNAKTPAHYIKKNSWYKTLQDSRARLLASPDKNKQQSWDALWQQLARDFPESTAEGLSESIETYAGVQVAAAGARHIEFYVSITGSDRNPGTREKPFATLTRARNAVRSLKRDRNQFLTPVLVIVRGGTYYLPNKIVLGPRDSGIEGGRPIIYSAAPGEKVILSGGKIIDTPWKTNDGKIYYTDIPEARNGKWKFRQLFVNNQRETPARYPNFDAEDILEKGWLWTINQGIQRALAGLQEKGDWIEYRFEIPNDGKYAMWLGYATMVKKPHSLLRLTIDGQNIPLPSLPASSDWRKAVYQRIADVTLQAGNHVMRWENTSAKGRQPIHLEAFSFAKTLDIATPEGSFAPVAPGEHKIVIQAVNEGAKQGGYSSTGFQKIKMDDVNKNNLPGDKIYVPAGTARQSWADAPQAEVFIWATWGWYNVIAQLTSVKQNLPYEMVPGMTASADVLTLKGREAASPIWQHNRFYVFNILEELDQPGEWYLDYKTGRLYYWPRKGVPDDLTIVAPRMDCIFELAADADRNQRVEHIVINGFRFAHTDYTRNHPAWRSSPDAAIQLKNAWHCAIENCSFVNIGGYAVRLFQDSCFNRIANNYVTQAGAGGVIMTGPIVGRRGTLPSIKKNSNALYLAPLGNLITSNHIHHAGVIKKYVAGIHADPRPCTMAYAPGNVISHNLIHDMPRLGIFAFSNTGGYVVEYNHIHHVLKESDDGGCIHFCTSRNDTAPTIMRNNILHDTVTYRQSFGKDKPGWGFGIYLDDFTSHVVLRNNIIYNTTKASIFYHGGKDNLSENNILVDSLERMAWFSRIRNDNRLIRNVISWHDPETKYLAYIKKFDQPADPHHPDFDYNLLWHYEKPVMVNNLSFEQWQLQGFDGHSTIADPLFVDAKKPEFGLKPESPAFKLGFKPIDVSKVGLRKNYPAEIEK